MNEQRKIEKRACPYCDGEITEAGFPFCKPCGVTLLYCVKCQTAVKREATVCPQCGGELEWK
ncbi:MAG: zinc ribbon domain-containing protein [Dehalococcoidia bacterium]|nr:MAG: zinc ribbon domain-containing protein [Dehalococcoidia bacterium]UCG82239.1 MAG: zinc ribbon domain-containing protein [Dehalococcoidia bacterium]